MRNEKTALLSVCVMLVVTSGFKFVTGIIDAVKQASEETIELEVGGRSNISLEKKGTYYLYLKRSTVKMDQSRLGLSGKIDFAVSGKEGPLDVTKTIITSKIGTTSLEGLYKFLIPAPGEYDFSLTVDDEVNLGERIFVIGKGMGKSLVLTILAGIGTFGFTGIIIFIVFSRKWEKQKK